MARFNDYLSGCRLSKRVLLKRGRLGGNMQIGERSFSSCSLPTFSTIPAAPFGGGNEAPATGARTVYNLRVFLDIFVLSNLTMSTKPRKDLRKIAYRAITFV
jgi:hypothetical protein